MERRGRQHRRSATLSDHLAAEEAPCKLQELLMIRDDADEMSALTAVAACARSFASSAAAAAGGGGRTLVEILREEQEAGEIVVGGNSSNGVNWRSLVACFCLRRAGTAGVAAASSSGHASLLPFPAPAGSNSPASTSLRGSTASASTAASPPEEPPAGGQEISDLRPPASATAAAAGVSLMSLLEQTDTQWSNGVEAASPPLLPDDDEPALDDIIDGGGALRVCCVCMMRLKGAAFIPCGHTFCRRCSRELWVNRGSCPLCNDHILEILNIF
ncbi:E3 ubiquitin-protein ligase COP1-like [Zingiber officinale]|uniref:RING-type domain-containing protein n=1 Tax=Zingiber officinale TaxID=94328 RepID=A0A8J5KMM3_ZINOF|nr:E3 ubiquitin-protein ligase COP1-like [Zingiber officinale]KAG6482793.1 hypothetical protein ZIOFF_059432 [Zingiber officinale]